MTKWREVQLGEIATVSWGDTRTTKASYVESGYIAYSASGPDGYLPHADHHEDGVVISAIGAQCGKTWFAKGAWSCIKNTMWLRGGPDAHTRFLFYATADPLQWPRRGAAQPFIGLGDAKLMRVRLPPLADQRRIAYVLGSFDDLIENNRRRVEMLEEMARAIYREWFVHFRYPGHENAAVIDSPLGPIPGGWTVTTLGQIATLDRTSVQPARFPDELFDHYSIPAFDDGQLPALDAGSTIRSGKFLVSSSSVLVSKLNPRIERTWFVEPGANRRSAASTEFLVLRTGDLASLEWLYLTIGSESFQQRLRELSGGTSTSHQRAKPDDFLATNTLLAPTDVITQFTYAVAAWLALARLLRVENRRLSELRGLLLPKLISGQIDVSAPDLEASVEGSVA